ncbi:uncharacterized protein LOC6576397 [Drosophila mojavensis]|uniref:Protein phosphatase 1 regulatory subunit 35 C-terminal domain-containing protein n=1 Tax=Drosophila mojavensis TaxID=7230 RepID=B4KE85_DROMO|nr:uncharacterized protein LOC6576397 [Drosophila mojavensis]EDW11830.1 uncharacterized protein Dmoj_GI17356 [Drosophila mojavensis]
MPHKRKTRLQYNPKQVSRRVQLASSAPNVCVKAHNGATDENFTPPEEKKVQKAPIVPQETAPNKFAVPQFNTMVRTQVEVNSVRNMRVDLQLDLTPRTKASIAPKVVKKLNFPSTQTVFKDLIPINVNDSLREVERPRTTKPRDSNKYSMAEPVLTDYLEKIEYVQLLMPEPELTMDFTFDEFDFLHAYTNSYRYI